MLPQRSDASLAPDNQDAIIQAAYIMPLSDGSG